MGWRSGEVWLDVDLQWFREPQVPALAAAVAVELPRFGPAETGLDASRRRRFAAESARRRRLATRTVPALALVVGSASMLSVSALRNRAGAHELQPLLEDPPSLTFRAKDFGFQLPGRPTPGPSAVERPERAEVEWRTAASIGLQYAGRLVDGTQLPVEGPNWVTWNPATDSSPNLPGRLYGHERTIRAVISVLAGYRAAHPDAARVVVGDVSFRHGGPMDQHVSHQNGLDVDVYYPRLDRWLRPPAAATQIDRGLSQDLLDRFLAAGAKIVFVGYSTGLHGPSDVVVPYPNHANHMHVRFAVPR